jgi:ketosteroid isomerase-like protein
MTMQPGELEVATRFRNALERAAQTGDWTEVYPCLADDVEWVTPKRTLVGIDEVEHDLIWGTPPEHLDQEFQVGEWVDLGDRRAAVDVHQVYRVKGSGDFAYERDLRIEIAIRDGKIVRYEIRAVG